MYLGYTKPFESRARNYVEITNEVFNMVATLHFMCFTEFVGEIETQVQMGWSLCIVLTLHIAFNMSLVFAG